MLISEIPEIKNLGKIYTPLRRKAWLPIVEECNPAEEISRFGGFPWMKEKQKWPSHHSSEMTLNFQIIISDFPAEFLSNFDLKSGYLQLFRLENEYFEDGKDSKVFIVDLASEKGKILDPFKKKNVVVFTEEDSARLKQLNAEKNHRSPEAMKLFQKLQKSYKTEQHSTTPAKKITGWTEVIDYPHPAELEEGDIDFPIDIYEFIGEIAEKYDLYEDAIEDYLDETYKCYGGDKLGGYPFWTQSVETPEVKKEKMIYFLQLDGSGNSAFKVDGTGHLFYEKANPENMKFIWACT